MTTGATIHTVNGLHVKLTTRDGAGGTEMDGYAEGASLGELRSVDVKSGTPEAGVESFDDADRARAKDLKEAAVVLGAATAGLTVVKSGSDGSKGEDTSVGGERFVEAVKEAEALFKEEAEIETATKKELAEKAGTSFNFTEPTKKGGGGCPLRNM